MKFIHITDTHYGHADQAILGRSPRFAMQTAIQDINEKHADADFVIITGDLTHYGEDAAYACFKDDLSELKLPCHLMIGNHDVRETALKHFPNMPTDDNGFVQQVITTPTGAFILLDTVQAGTHEGFFCQKRQDWLKKQLQTHKDKPVYLFTHHAPFKIGMPVIDAIGLNPDDTQALTAIVSEYDNVKHLFLGHYHLAIAGRWQDISFTTLRGMNHQTLLDLDQTADKCYTNFQQPQYCIALLDDDNVIVHYNDFMDNSPAVHNDW